MSGQALLFAAGIGDDVVGSLLFRFAQGQDDIFVALGQIGL